MSNISISNGDYVAPEYVQPEVFRFVGGIVDEASGTGATSLIAFVTGSREDQVDYVKSMMGLGIFFIVIVALWFLTLWLIKCGGKDRMGCAAGFGFHDSDSDKQEDLAERRKWKQHNGNFNSHNKDTLFKGDGGAVSVGAAYTGGASVALDAGNDDDDDNRHRSNSFFGFMGGTVGRNSSGHTQDTAASRRQELTTLAMKNTIDKNGDFQYDSDGSPTEEIDAISHYVEPDAPFSPPKSRSSRTTVSALYSIPKKTVQNNHQPTMALNSSASTATSKYVHRMNQTPCCSYDPAQVQRRKFRTRFMYAVFALGSLACSALLIQLMYYPLQSAATTTGEVVQDAQTVVSEVDAALQVMEEAATTTKRLIDSGDLPLKYEAICPQYASSDFSSQFGFDPEEVISTIQKEYKDYISQALSLLAMAQNVTGTVTDVLAGVDSTVQNTEDHLWIIPLTVCITMLVTFAFVGLMAGVIYRERTIELKTDAPKIEKCFGWTFLPLMIIVVLMSWGLVIAFCFGVVGTTDMCIGETTGKPEENVLALLQAQADGSLDGDTLALLSIYVDGCRGGDPLEEVVTLQGLLRQSLNSVNERVAIAENLGFDLMEVVCGEGNMVQAFFGNIKVLQGHFNDVDSAISSAYNALSCPRINALYIRVMHDALCTDFAIANSNGFLLFLFAGLSGMVLISLRAAWRSSE